MGQKSRNDLAAMERAQLRRLMRRMTVADAVAAVGVSRFAMERACAGLGIRAGTAALIRQALARIDNSSPAVS
jgi:hypothetical protein